MINTPTFIKKEIVDKVVDTAQLNDIIDDFLILKKQGSSRVGTCPSCGGKKFTFTPGKEIYKCFNCDIGGNSAVKFLTEVMGKTFQEAIAYLADRYQIPLEEDKPLPRRKRGARNITFRDEQLKGSGIPDRYQKWYEYLGDANNSQEERDRYQAGTIDKGWNIVRGDDMILHYIDLDGKVMYYNDHRGKPRRLIRVRWANPELHKDKSGNPIKYQSPKGSGSHLWLPNRIIELYKKNEVINTLYITEGEKKADAMCLAGLSAVGIMGIHNFSGNTAMPHQFEMIVKRCGVQNIVMLLDSDWQDISLKPNKPVDSRPNTFYRAVVNFRNYFYAFGTRGIELRIFFGAGKDQAYKGIDDVITRQYQDKAEELVKELDELREGHEVETEHFELHEITSIGDYRLKQYWYLHSPTAFFDKHREQLMQLREFTYGRVKRRYNKEEDTFELAQKIFPHEQFWKETVWEDRSGNERKKIEFRYDPCLKFLYNRGYGLYEYDRHQYRFIRQEDKIVEETTPLEIRKFMIDFARQLENPEIVELVLRGGKQYFGPDNMQNLWERPLQLMEPQKDKMYFFFQESYWEITADKIEQKDIKDLPGHVWQNKQIDFKPRLLDKPMLSVEREGDSWKTELSDDFYKCDMAVFNQNTSFFAWRKLQEEIEVDGKKMIVERQQPDKMSAEEIEFWKANLVSKMLATGYVLHDYRDYSKMKAIIAMDGAETEVGKSQGGTGKSIWGKQFQHIFPLAVIDGKRKNLEDDNFLYEDVDERTGAIVYDDVRVNFNFESLFSQITTSLQVNKKGERKFSIEPPKFIVITNHAINGEGNSFKRRQYSISFSDYYNGARTVADEFGHQLFYDWDHEQWNLFYNWMATCVQTYLRYGLAYRIPGDVLERRKLRQRIGENFLAWASLMFDETPGEDGKPMGILLNKQVEKGFITKLYLEEHPNDRKYMDARKVKERIQLYCEYAGLDYNPTKQGKRIKSNGKEYFIVADENFSANNIRQIDNQGDLDRAASLYEKEPWEE